MHEDVSTSGPLEWVALSFPGTALEPRVVPPIKDLVDAGTVRLLDAAVLHKDADGAVSGRELDSEGLQAFTTVDGDEDSFPAEPGRPDPPRAGSR